MDTLHVACASRRDFLPHMAVMLHSLLAVEAPAVRAHVLHAGDYEAEAIGGLQRMFERHGASLAPLHVRGRRVERLTRRYSAPPAQWFRIFLPELLPDVDRILYLDGDLLVLDSLRPLWRTELGRHPIAAVTNVFQDDEHRAHARLVGVDPATYFNSGVLLLDLARMREEDLSGILLERAMREPERFGWVDQDVLNLELGPRRLALHPRWNCMNSFWAFPWSAEAFGSEAVEEAKRSPAIRHFEGPGQNKPWHRDCPWPGREHYAKHRAQTPWPEWEAETEATRVGGLGARRRGRLRRLRRLGKGLRGAASSLRS